MHFKFFEYAASDNKHHYCKYPEIERPERITPESRSHQNSLPVPVDHIINRIEFKYHSESRRNNIYIPHNRRKPDSHLKNYVYYLRDIPEKYGNGARKVRNPQ